MQSAAVQVDVAAIRRGANRADFRARAPEQVRGQVGCRSIAAIDHDTQSIEWSGNGGQQVVHIAATESLVHGEFRQNGLDTGIKYAEDLLLDGLPTLVGK